jgi:glutaminyl-tRNA synthetase
MENPPSKYFRLALGKEVRLRYAYFVTCTSVEKDEQGNITAIHCTYDPASKGGNSPDGRKVKGTIHWVNANDCIEAEIRLFDRLFTAETPDKVEEGKTFVDYINKDSLQVLEGCKLEKSLAEVKHLDKFQFERLGYFSVDYDSTSEHLVFNRACTLKDSWTKQ